MEAVLLDAGVYRDLVMPVPQWPVVISAGGEVVRWWETPDGWIAIFTFTLTVATIALGIATWRLWKATEKAVGETAKGLDVARDTAEAARRQAEVAERVGMIQNINPLHGHLHYIASCALYGTRPSEGALAAVPGPKKGFGHLLERLEHGPAGDLEAGRAIYALSNGTMRESLWEQLIPSPHLDDFLATAQSIAEIARTAKVSFLVDRRVIRILDFRGKIAEARAEISRLQQR